MTYATELPKPSHHNAEPRGEVVLPAPGTSDYMVTSGQ